MPPLALAWRNLAHHRVRTLIAVVGVAFAVLLIFMQVGFYRSVTRTATMLYDHLAFDLLIASAEHQDLTRLRSIPRGRLAQARSAAGVAAVHPLAVGSGAWRNPDVPTAWWEAGTGVAPGSGSSIFMLGVPPDAVADIFRTGSGGVFPDAASAGAAGRRLARLDTALIDRTSRPEFGRYDFLRTLPADRGGTRLNGQRVELVGEFELGTGFNWKGMLITGEETFARLTFQPPGETTFGLVRLESGADPGAVRAGLRAALPGDVQVFTPDEAAAIEVSYWVHGNALGQLLAAGAGLAVVVGVIFLYQMMSADIRNQLAEYATAKALGYRPGYLSAVVLWQAGLLALLGYVPGLAAAAVLYEVAKDRAGLPMALDPGPAVAVLALTEGMCVGSGLLAVRKVHSADPASLF